MVSENFWEITGYEAHEMIGTTLQILRGHSNTSHAIESGLERGKASVDVTVVYRKDGSCFYGYWTVESLFNPDGAAMFHSVLLLDIMKELKTPLAKFLEVMPDRTSTEFQCSARMRHNQSRASATTSTTPSVISPEIGGAYEFRYTPPSLKGKDMKERVHSGIESMINRLGQNMKNRAHMHDQHSSASRKSSPSISSPANCETTINHISNCLQPISQSIILKRRDRRIMYIPERTLRFLGFPTKSRQETCEPPLLKEDFVTCLYAGSTKETNDMINFIHGLFTNGAAGACRCMIRCNSQPMRSDRDSAKNKVSGVLDKWVDIQFVPLVTGSGNCALYVASFR